MKWVAAIAAFLIVPGVVGALGVPGFQIKGTPTKNPGAFLKNNATAIVLTNALGLASAVWVYHKVK